MLSQECARENLLPANKALIHQKNIPKENMALSDTCLDSINEIANSMRHHGKTMVGGNPIHHIDALYSLATLVVEIDSGTTDVDTNLISSRIVIHALLDSEDIESAVSLVAHLARSDRRLLNSLDVLRANIEAPESLLNIMKNELFAELSSRVLRAHKLANQ